MPGFESPRSRCSDLGIKIGVFPHGDYNAITDIQGVKVGHTTLWSGEGKLSVGKGPIRTGVTAIIPAAGDVWSEKITGGSFVLNGNGEAIGLMWLQESGIIETPIALTNTLSVAEVQRALVNWTLKAHPELGISDDTFTPLVFECDDGSLNDIQGQHIQESHVFEALEKATSGPVAEGCVGAGAGMISYEFKGGIGTSSRVVAMGASQEYRVGVLVNTNHGRRHTLRFNGFPVGRHIRTHLPTLGQEGSIVVVIATDAPLDARQLNRLAKRSMLGVARTGGVAQHGSGDVAIAFSTANRISHKPKQAEFSIRQLSDFWINDLMEACVDAAEEAVLNALLSANTTVGRDDNVAHKIPLDQLARIIEIYRAAGDKIDK